MCTSRVECFDHVRCKIFLRPKKRRCSSHKRTATSNPEQYSQKIWICIKIRSLVTRLVSVITSNYHFRKIFRNLFMYTILFRCTRSLFSSHLGIVNAKEPKAEIERKKNCLKITKGHFFSLSKKIHFQKG